MDKDIVIKRKLNITIQSVVVLSLCILFFLWPLAWAIKDFESFMYEFENNGILLLICIAIGIPILVCTLIVYVKCLFDKTPILTINNEGIYERLGLRTRKIGLIKWKDIEKVKIKKDLINMDFICIYFKEPEKYIKKEKELNRIKRKGPNCNFGHVYFTSLYFKNELNAVIDSIQYYFSKHNEKAL